MMYPHLKLILLLGALAFSSIALASAQSAERPDGPISLTLKVAVERALKNNLSIQDRELGLKISEMRYEDAWDRMYMPTISLNFDSTSSKTVAHLWGDQAHLNGTSKDEHGFPTSAAGVSLGTYTLFNFGKDKIVFKNAELDWARAKERIEEYRRDVKFRTIIAFWNLKTALDKLDSTRRGVEIAQAILDLQRSRVRVGQSTTSDVSSSKIDLNTAKNAQGTAETRAVSTLWKLNVLLGDPVGTPYTIEDDIQFLPIKVTEEVLLDVYLQNSPNIKDSKSDIIKSELAVELEEKNLLPLPKVTFSGITLNYANDYYGTRPDFYTKSSGRSNVDVSANVSLSIPLTGPGGLFNQRTVRTARFERDQADIHLKQTISSDKSEILALVQNIRQLEDTVSNNKQSYQDSISVLQSVLENLTKSKIVSRLEVKDAINQAVNSELELSTAILDHLTSKTQLASLIGVDYLPRMDQ